MAVPREEHESDSLASLEERVTRAVEVVSALRQERDQLAQKLSASEAEASRLADELDHTFGLIDLLPQHLAQVAAFGSENILPNRLVSQKGQGVGYELPRTAQLLAHGRNENGRARRHGGRLRIGLIQN